MAKRNMLCSVPGLTPRLVFGDPSVAKPARDGSGMLVYVQDIETGSMILVGRQYLFEADNSDLVW